jgi:hypothetical protein
MNKGDLPFPDRPENSPGDCLQRFVGVFGERGWLNRSFRIMHRERKYRVFCSETQFIAQRIPDQGDIPWGFPCWVVCLVNPDQIIGEPDLSAFGSAEPTVQDWLRALADGDFKVI